MLARAIIGYLAAIYLALLLFLAVYGAALPRADDLRALRRADVDGPVVLVGLMVAEYRTPFATRFEDRRYYVALPASFTEQALWVAVQENLQPPAIRRSGPAFWAVLLTFMASLAGFWWGWFRRHDGTPPNNSSKPTPLRGAA